ncbi:uncharacterized protein LOC143894189 [Temnothorax americanus]|uniref:uncharacterized protein LOC143894189 n=1 Tax=Temnothorax americanus TaxID=1964332 RepID=UPI004067FF51
MERNSAMESQMKDKEALMSLLDEPFEDQVAEVERTSTDIESVSFALLDLLREIWNPECSALQILRLLLASVSKYLTTMNQKRTDCDVRRMHEGSNIKSVLTELHKLWLKEGPKSPTCSVTEMYNFIRDRLLSKLYSSLVSDLMTQDTFYEWINYHDRYVKSLPVGARGDIPAAVSTDHSYSVEKRDEEEEEAGCSGDGGLDALFDLTESGCDLDRIPQHISKMKDRRMLTVRSPGEIGSQLIRLDVYDIKDIANKDRRDWWKYAKLRSQILTTLSRTDRKQLLVRQLLDQAADDLRKIPGVTKETRNVIHESGV